MRPLPKLLSKTKIMRGYRCLKSIYLTIHRPELEPKITADLQALFDQGNRVGEEARKFYPGGVLVDFPPWGFVDSLKKTRELIASGHELIYEAAFEYKGCYARADIVRYNKLTQRWTILEVKGTTKLKDEHLDDVGLQAWIIANSGLPVEKICVVHLNPECRFPDLRNLFVECEVTERLRERYPSIGPKMTSIFKALRSPAEPAIEIGPHCTENRDCEFVEHCFTARAVPEISVLDVYLLKNKWELFAQGQVRLEDLDTSSFSDIQRRMVEAHVSGQRFVDRPALSSAVKEWKYPLVFLDFETINPAIPRYIGCGPYTQTPFQFSAHVVSFSGDVRHHEFLHTSAEDPRPSLIPALLSCCAQEGSIVAYNAKFEMRVIQGLADHFPEFKDELEALLPRFVDPLPLIRESVYDPGFAGGFGLKVVAPSLLGESSAYGGMGVADGGAAQRAFEELIASHTPDQRREELRRSLLNYCRKDTEVMVDLVNWMRLGTP